MDSVKMQNEALYSWEKYKSLVGNMNYFYSDKIVWD